MENEILSASFQIADASANLAKVLILCLQKDGRSYEIRAGSGLNKEDVVAAVEEELAACAEKQKAFLRDLSSEHSSVTSIGWSMQGATGSLTSVWNEALGQTFISAGWKDAAADLVKLIASFPKEAREMIQTELAKIHGDIATR